MARRYFDKNSTNPLHITNRMHDKKAFPIPIQDVWEVMQDLLYFINKCYEIRIFSFVLMPNHYHLMAQAVEGNISEAMWFFNRESSRLINRYAKKSNQIWGNRYHKCEITEYSYFINAFKYVYQNPLRAKLVNKVEDYKFSTLRGKLGMEWLCVTLSDEIVLNGCIEEELRWLNTLPDKNESKMIASALRRTQFKYPRYKGYKSPLLNKVL
jgi:putative transposase